MTIGEKKNKGSNLLYTWSRFMSKNDVQSLDEYQSPADIEEQMQLEFAIWRSGSTTYEGGSSEAREEAELHFDDRRALATVGMPAGLSFLVDPPGVCKKVVGSDGDIQEWIHFSDRFYKVQILPLHNHFPVELSPNGEAECTDLEKLDLLLSNLFVAKEAPRPDLAEHLCSTKLKKLVSQKRMQETLGGKLHVPLQECMKDLKRAKDLTQVLEALAMFCSHYQAYLQVLGNEPAGDQEEGNPYDDKVTLEVQIKHLDRWFQEQVCEQVNYAAAACQVAAQVVAEVSKLGALMLTGDGFSPNTTYQHSASSSEPTKEALAKDKELSSSQRDQATNSGFEYKELQNFMIVPRAKDDDVVGDVSWVNEVDDGDTEVESSLEYTVLPRLASNKGLDKVRMMLDPVQRHTKGISMLHVGAQKTYDDLSKLLDCARGHGGCSNSEDGPGLSDLRFCKGSHLEQISPDLDTRVTSKCVVEASPETPKRPPKKSKIERCPEESIVFQEQIGALCLSANQKAVLDGNVLQWCSIKFLKECYTIQIVIQVAEFMEDDLALLTTGISLTLPLVVEIALEPLHWSQTLMAGAYQVCAYQGTWETRCTEPSIALASFIPHVVRHYLSNAQQNGAESKEWLDHSLLIGLIKHIVRSLAFLKYKCVICEENHFDLGHGSSLFPRPCAKDLCKVLFSMWMMVTPKKILTPANIKTWLRKKYKQSNRTDITMLEDKLKRFEVDSKHMNFQEKIQMLALTISWKAEVSWVQVSTEEATENAEGNRDATLE